jgi:NAD(P)H-nitrite reductase large subunit
MDNYVIIGNGPAAVGAIEGIRQIDANCGITLLSKEKYHTYSRPLISYLLQGKTDLNKMKYRPDDFYANSNVEFVNAEAREIDSKAKTVFTEKGGFKYKKLLIATGGKPFVPNIEGLGGVKDKFTFMSLDDALELEKKLSPDVKR